MHLQISALKIHSNAKRVLFFNNLCSLQWIWSKLASSNYTTFHSKWIKIKALSRKCPAHWLHGICAKNQVPIHKFRETIRLNVALHYFFTKRWSPTSCARQKVIICMIMQFHNHIFANSILCFSTTGCLYAIPGKWSVHHGGFGVKFSFLHGRIGLYYLG